MQNIHFIRMNTYIIDFATEMGIFVCFLAIGLCVPIARLVTEILKDRW
ncbi:MAG: hypothetical protein RLZZ517_475 [Candidatus Parcubacteria bacterium]|jgi:hypothetical protein